MSVRVVSGPEVSPNDDLVKIKISYNEHTITAFLPTYILDDFGSLTESRANRREQYIPLFNQNEKRIIEKIVEKFNKNGNTIINLIGHDFITEGIT